MVAASWDFDTDCGEERLNPSASVTIIIPVYFLKGGVISYSLQTHVSINDHQTGPTAATVLHIAYHDRN